MSWISLLTNQGVSLDNLKDAVTTGVFTAKTTIPSGSKEINKTEADTYVNINTGWPSYAAKSSTEIIVKRDLVSVGSATLTFSFVNAGGSFLQFVGSLSTPVDANIVITRIFSDGFAASPCLGGSSISSSQSNSTNTLTTGGSGIGFPPDSSTGTWVSATKYSIYNVIVNGIPVTNGTTLTIGSYTVTIIIPSCI